VKKIVDEFVLFLSLPIYKALTYPNLLKISYE